MSYTPPPTWSLVEPPPAVEAAADLLALAAAALEVQPVPDLRGKERIRARRRQLGIAHAYARAVDWTAMEWFWIESGREAERRHDERAHQSYAGARANPTIPAAIKRAVAARDGWRCRYCRIRVVSSATLTKLEEFLPAALPLWPAEMGPAEVTAHAAQCVLRLTWDHVAPRSAGGTNTEENVVATCGTCNFSKSSCTLEELGLLNPLSREPLASDGWDGLDGRLGARRLWRNDTSAACAGVILVVYADSGKIGTITVEGDTVTGDPPGMTDMLEARIARGMSAQEAAEDLKGWSNGYIAVREQGEPDPFEPLRKSKK
ncbi:MAG TPA: HNH endonuclease signature motif containing protein [Acidimicrobiales bacterium]|nr:HNH endonuclease signature motif containing protein [Acidimicrobiales bacterium]